MAKLTTIEGIGEKFAEQLKAAGAGTVEKLLEIGSTRTGRKKLSEASGVDPKRILRFVTSLRARRGLALAP